MISKNALYLTTLFFFFIKSGFGQGPPPPAMPKDSNAILVDQIIKVTHHEDYFLDYCTKKVNDYAAKNNWTSEKKKKALEGIKFEYYNSTIYNSYAFYSIDQLKTMLEAITLLNKDSKGLLSTMILTNSMMQGNLDLFVNGLIGVK